MSPNDIVFIKPTEHGWSEILASVDEFNDSLRKRHPNARFRMSVPEADEEGYIKGQFWSLMQYFDWSVGAGGDTHFYEMRIKEQP